MPPKTPTTRKKGRASAAAAAISEMQSTPGLQTPTITTDKTFDLALPPGSVDYVKRSAVSTTITFTPVTVYILTNDLQDVVNMKGRLIQLIHQLFFSYRHISTDKRSSLFNLLLPAHLEANRTELYAYFEKTYTAAQIYYRSRVAEYGRLFLEQTPAGIAWRAWMQELDQQTPLGKHSSLLKQPNSNRDLLEWEGVAGLAWTKFQVIDFFRKFLIGLETEDAPDGMIGWIANDEDGYWLSAISEVILSHILLFVRTEGPRPGTIKTNSLTKLMETLSTPAGDHDWPELDPKTDPVTLVDNKAPLPKAFADFNVENDVVDPGAALPSNLVPTQVDNQCQQQEQLASVIENDDAVLESNPGMLEQLKEHAEHQQNSFLVATEKALDDAGTIRPLKKLRISKEEASDPVYENRLATEYAALNIWGQVELSLVNVNHKIHCLDAASYALSEEKKQLQEKRQELLETITKLNARLAWMQNHASEVEQFSVGNAELKRRADELQAKIDRPTWKPRTAAGPSGLAAGKHFNRGLQDYVPKPSFMGPPVKPILSHQEIGSQELSPDALLQESIGQGGQGRQPESKQGATDNDDADLYSHPHNEKTTSLGQE
jgi:hypothetical protein